MSKLPTKLLLSGSRRRARLFGDTTSWSNKGQTSNLKEFRSISYFTTTNVLRYSSKNHVVHFMNVIDDSQYFHRDRKVIITHALTAKIITMRCRSTYHSSIDQCRSENIHIFLGFFSEVLLNILKDVYQFRIVIHKFVFFFLQKFQKTRYLKLYPRWHV